ncbi:EscU/YscU/HrcU family type III secretion system export apparatus switch protein [Virgibacillus soli]|uniref:EscU/YscU/HrcU family type III secretion system export apparatus switch protein n=1 Tax=Paracerasibacillus soli TaxID=480284 RepID=A0ABU5CP56_9BACI|nr:EscU/YscU/HrcU family type III secretion system export apparatus switch protein [Virgibacillus soli]MDY0408148.1 EscU/YscU/HrcU family type III secretion system export apparatus switch protein [Virgibacillus soli]
MKKLQKAVALTYNKEKDHAPKVTASGKGLIADNMIKLANNENIPIMQDTSLVNLLVELNINKTIPPDLYEAVAEVFAFIYEADKIKK